MVDFRILGRFEVDGASGPLDISGAKRRSLLALLVAHAGETLTRDRIVDALWGDSVTGADHTVQTYISQLRKTLESDVTIATYGRGYRLDVPRDAIDAFRFLDTARKAADIVDLERRREVLGEALACWRGRALEEFSGAEWADAASQRLDQQRLEVLEQRIDADLALGRARELLGELEDLVRTYPFAEPLWAQRMLALYRCGRQADALRAFAELRSSLAEELGIEPSRALVDLELRILDQDEALRLPDDARAHPVPASATPNLPAGTVTFLLTDIVSSTEMWESSSDAMAATVRAHEAIIEAVIVAHGGHLLKHRGEGDSTLSAFDRAADAMAAAIELQSQMEEKRNALPLPISIRVALHTGEVEQRDRDYFGRTLNRAARIRALASGDDIMCSRATAELAADSLPSSASFVELGPQQLRGLHRTEVVFRVVRHGPDVIAAPGPSKDILPDEPSSRARLLPPRLEATLTGPPLVGRRQERSLLEEHWHRARNGQQQVVFVSGEPGIGKTRLAAEVARIAEADGATILYGHADEGLGVPYQPFVEALRAHVDACNDDELRRSLGEYPGELVRLLPEIATRVNSLPPPLRSDAATEQYRLFDSVTSWLSTFSRRTPLLLVLDDLHDAADPTFLLLRHVASSQRLDALVIPTFRQSEPTRANAPLRLLADLRTASPIGSVEHIELRGLDEADVSEFVEGASGHELDEAAQAFVATLHTHTGGNPFFINEVLRNLVETGAIAGGSGAFSDVRLGEIRIPAAARDVVLRRVARLSDHAQHALTVAAVIGNEFDVDLLEAVTGIDDEDLLLALEEALAARLIEERGLERFAFAHALVQAALYEDLTESRKTRLHGRVGDAIERTHASPDGVWLSQLAYHFARAAPDKAVRYAVEAADVALESSAFEDAENVCARALAAVARARDTRRTVSTAGECDVLLRLGRAEFGMARPRARDTLLHSYALARNIGDPQRAADALLAANRGFFARMGRVDRELVDALEQAIAMQPAGQDAVLAELLAALASELEWADDGDRRFQLSDRAVEIARNVDDPGVLARVLTLRTITIDAPDTLQERIADCDELLGLADTIGDPAIGFHAVWSRSPTAVESGDADAVDELVEIASNLADDLRLPAFLWQASFMRTARLILRGELDEAEQLANQTLQLGQRAGQQVEAFVFYNEQILEIRRWQDRLGEVSRLLRDFAGADLWDFGYSLTRYLYDAHEIELATARYESIVQRAQLPPRRDLLAGTSLCNLAYLATRLGDTERAAQLYDLIEPYRSAFASTTVAKPVGEHFLGLIAAALDDFSAAERHFERACHAHERARAPLLLAETQVEWAAVLGRQGEAGRARELGDAARANVQGRGAAYLERRCDEGQV